MLSQILATLTRVTVAEFNTLCAMLCVAHLPAEHDAIAYVIPARTCLGCKGTGRHPSRHGFGYGICAACKGKGEKAAEKVTSIEALKALIKNLKKETGELSDQRWTEWAALPAETRAAVVVAANEAHGDFGESVRKGLRTRGRLTPGQILALMKPKAPAAEKVSAKVVAPLTAGRQPIKGTVVSLKNVAGDYGMQLKMLVKLESGARVFGAVPAKIANTVKAGDEVSLTATVQPKEADFGFFSRPTLS